MKFTLVVRKYEELNKPNKSTNRYSYSYMKSCDWCNIKCLNITLYIIKRTPN